MHAADMPARCCTSFQFMFGSTDMQARASSTSNRQDWAMLRRGAAWSARHAHAARQPGPSHDCVTCIMVQLISTVSTSSSTWLTRAAILDTCSAHHLQIRSHELKFNGLMQITHQSCNSGHLRPMPFQSQEPEGCSVQAGCMGAA